MKKTMFMVMLSVFVLFGSCSPEKEEPCIETICPDGFNSCIEKPCEF